MSTHPENIVKFLLSNPEGCSAKMIARALKLERKHVNHLLYGKLLKENKVTCDNSSSPPIWKIVRSDENSNDSEDEKNVEEIRNIVFVDLGNIHNILQKLENYADDKECSVYAFADCAFNGFGINPPPKNKNIHVFQTKDEHKNAADVEMIWTAAELVVPLHYETSEYRFIIFTRDNGFRSLKTILERYSSVKEVIFAQTWEHAREFIE